MSDDLSPFFQGRDTRLGYLPQEVRTLFEKAQQNSGDDQFTDRQFSSMWMSKRTGLPQKEVLDNFDALATRYFGEGATAATAYDKISATYKTAAPEESTGEVLPKQAPTDNRVLLHPIKDIGGSLAGGASDASYTALGGVLSQLATSTGVTLALPSDSPEYQQLKLKERALDDPNFIKDQANAQSILPVSFRFTNRPENQRSWLSMGDEDRKAEGDRTRARIKEIEAETQAANIAAIDKWKAESPVMAGRSQWYRDMSNTMYELASGSVDAYGVSGFKNTTIGQFTQSAGSLPVTALMGAMRVNPLGTAVSFAATESMMFGQVERERMQIEGETYNPERAWFTNTISAAPQAALEFSTGMERAMEHVIKDSVKIGGKISFGEATTRMLKTGLKAGFEEGLTEPTQNFWGDFVASQTYDEKRQLFSPEALKQRMVEGASAFALGFLFGGGIQSLQVVDSNAAVRKGADYLTTREGQPLTSPDFNVLRSVKTDDQILSSAPDEETGRLLLSAANGDVASQQEYNNRTLEALFKSTDGLEVHGFKIGEVNGNPALISEDGTVDVFDMKDPEQREFFEEVKRDALAAQQEAEQASIEQDPVRAQRQAELEETFAGRKPDADQRESMAEYEKLKADYKAQQESDTPPEVTFADRAIAALESVKISKPGQINAATPFSLAWDGAIDTAILAIKGGQKLNDVITAAVANFRTKYGKTDPVAEAQLTAAIQQHIAPQQASVTQQVAQAATGMPQNKTQAMQMKAQQIRTARLVASANFAQMIAQTNTIPQKTAKLIRSYEIGDAGRLLLPLTERLRYLGENIGALGVLRKFEFNLGRDVKAYRDMTAPLQRGMAAMTATDGAAFDYAVSNSDTITRDRILQKYGLVNAYAQTEAMLTKVRDRGIKAGMDIGLIEDYFPRQVLDVTKLRDFYGSKPVGGVIDEALRKSATAKGGPLTIEEESSVISNVLNGRGRAGSKPGNTKARVIEVIPPAAWKFYAPASHALNSYIDRMTDEISKREFFGKHLKTTPSAIAFAPSQIDLKESIGPVIAEMIARKELDPEGQAEMANVISARFSGRIAPNTFFAKGSTADKVVSLVFNKNLTYAVVLGRVSSAMTQMADLIVAVYEAGPVNTISAAAKAVYANLGELPVAANIKAAKGQGTAAPTAKRISRDELGVDRIAHEFSDLGKAAAFVDQVFRATGFHFMDLIGKETLINAKFAQLQNQAVNGNLSKKNQSTLDGIFGVAKAQDVITDFAQGKKTDDTLFAVYNTMADWQPISQSEYPEGYLKAGSLGRTFYMLKTYTLKAFAAYRRVGIMQMWHGDAKEKIVGAANLTKLLSLMFLAGASIDWLKDFLMEREPEVEDVMVDNLFKLMGVSRWTIWQHRNRHADASGVEQATSVVSELPAIMTEALTPPLIWRYPLTDVGKFAEALRTGEDMNLAELDSWQLIPLIGDQFYWRFGGGKVKTVKRQEKKEKKEAKEMGIILGK